MVKYEMSGKTIFDGASPKTQSIDAVKALLAWRGRGSDPLPSDVSLDNGRVVLVLSNKKDVYYVVTPKACSCPSQTYRGGPCKHQRRYFPGPQKSREELEAEGERELAGQQEGIRPEGKWPHGCNGPVNMPDAKVVA